MVVRVTAQIDVGQISEIKREIMQSGDTVGIYVDVNDHFDEMLPINSAGMKLNTLGSAMSYGIAKAKMKVEYTGETSPYQLTSPAHFRMYFGLVPQEKAIRYYMFSGSYSVRDFSVVRFKSKKNNRQLVQGTYSIWTGSQTGARGDEDIAITFQQVSDGVYDVWVYATPGEYAFLFTNNGVGAYQAVFDFSIVQQ